MPCILAFPDRVAFGSSSTELGEVNIFLKPYQRRLNSGDQKSREIAYLDEQLVSEETFPGVLRIVGLVLVDKDGPVRPSYREFLVLQLLSDTDQDM